MKKVTKRLLTAIAALAIAAPAGAQQLPADVPNVCVAPPEYVGRNAAGGTSSPYVVIDAATGDTLSRHNDLGNAYEAANAFTFTRDSVRVQLTHLGRCPEHLEGFLARLGYGLVPAGTVPPDTTGAPTDTVPQPVPPPTPPPPPVGDTVYASSLAELDAVVTPRIGSGAGAVQQGGSFTGAGYRAAAATERLVIPHASMGGLDPAKGTITYTYLPEYDSGDGTKKRDVLMLGSWGTSGWHFGKHATANGNGLYFQYVTSGGQRAYETLDASGYPAWRAGDMLSIRHVWDASQGTMWLRTWIDGCEVTGIRSSIQAGDTPAALTDSLVIGSRRGANPIFAEGEVRDLVVLSEPVPETAPCGGPPPPPPPPPSSTDSLYVVAMDSTTVTLALAYQQPIVGAGVRSLEVQPGDDPSNNNPPVCPPFYTSANPQPSPAQTVCQRGSGDYVAWVYIEEGAGAWRAPDPFSLTIPAVSGGPPPAPPPPPPPPPPPAGVDSLYVAAEDSLTLTLGLVYAATPTDAVGARGGPTPSDSPVCPPFWTSGSPQPSPARSVCQKRSQAYDVYAVGSGILEGPVTVPEVVQPPAPPPPPPGPPPPPAPPPPGGWPAGITAPQASPDTVRPAIQRTVRVATAGELQTAINAARPGDEILVAPGTYSATSGFTLPPRNDGGWVVIRGDVSHPMVRVDTTAALPVITCPGSGCAPIHADQSGDHGWRLELLEVEAPHATNAAIRLHVAGTNPPRRFVLDRVYVHSAGPTAHVRRAVLGNAASVAVLRSALVDMKENGSDTQAFVAWNSPGPILLYDNLLSAASENIMFGGADPASAAMVPADIVIARNHVWKDPAWRGAPYNLKNLIEFKIGKRAHVWGNVFENNWRAAQAGYAVLLKSTNQSGGPGDFSVTEDVYFERNILRNVDMGFNLARATEGAILPMNRIMIANVLIDRLGPQSDYGDGASRTFLIQGPDDLTIRNVTAGNAGMHSAVYIATRAGDGFVFADNVFTGPTQYGWIVQGGINYTGLALAGNYAPADNCSKYPAGWVCTTPPPGAGADLAAVNAATAGVVR